MSGASLPLGRRGLLASLRLASPVRSDLATSRAEAGQGSLDSTHAISDGASRSRAAAQPLIGASTSAGIAT